MRWAMWAAVAGLIAGRAWAAPPATIASPGRAVHVATKTYRLDYTWPAAAGRIPRLQAWLDADARRERASLVADVREERMAEGDGAADLFPFWAKVDWRVVADLPGSLSLSSGNSDYTGGAHRNYGFASLLWDKAAARRRTVLDVFAGKAAFRRAIHAPFCAGLNRVRSQRRGEPVPRPRPPGEDVTWDCIDPAREVVILGSTDHRHFTRIGILIAPYDAGSFAEGSYEVTLPVNPAVIAAVKPEYRASFAPAR